MGGHTARVTGARYLAALGVEFAVIQLMARLAPAVILAYARDAPLLTITGATKIKTMARADHDATVIQSWREQALKKQLDEMASRLTQVSQDCDLLQGVSTDEDILERDELVDEITLDGGLDGLVAFVNSLNDKTHIAKVAPSTTATRDQRRARCPWHYGYVPRRTTTPSSALEDTALRPLLCKRCWRGILPAGTKSSSSESCNALHMGLLKPC